MFLLLAVPILAALYSLPLIFRCVPPNRFYGFRNRRTRQNPEIWYRANRIGGIALLIAMAICVAIEFSIPDLRNTPAGQITSVIVQIGGLIIANAYTTLRILMRSRKREQRRN